MSTTDQTKQLLQILETLPSAVFVLDDTDTIVYANASAQAMAGATPEEVIGTSWWEHAPYLVSAALYQAVQQAKQTREPTDVAYVSPVTQRWLHVHLAPTEEGLTLLFQKERAQARHQGTLLSSERHAVAVLNDLQIRFALLTPEGILLEINETPLDQAHIRREEVIGKPLAEAPWWSSAPASQKLLRAAITHANTGETVRFEAPVRPKEGLVLHIEYVITSHMGADHHIAYLIISGTDITVRKRAEADIHTLIDAIPQLVWTGRPDGYVNYYNQSGREYVGMTPEQIQGEGWLQCLHPDDRQRTLEAWQTAVQTGSLYEIEQRLRHGTNGDYRWFLTRGKPLKDPQGTIVQWVGTSTNIDEQKRIEEALRQSQERVNVLMNSRIIGTFLAEDELVVDANDTYLHMTGYSREDLCAGRINWMQMTPPEYRARTQQERQELVVHQYGTPYEKEYICQDGSRLPVLVGVVALRLDPLYTIGFVLDNSARKELEQRKDDFLSMAGHELRTPLTAVKMQTQLVRRRLVKQAHHEAATELSRVEEPIKQLERLIGELLDVSKMQAGRLEYVQGPVNLDVLLREIIDTLQPLHPGHTILLRDAVQISLMGDRDRLGQVFTNLISNAIKYSPNAKTVEIDLDASPEAVTIRVRDHGLGIPREQRDKIFERFYRAAGPRQREIAGLGMGLYIVAEIIKHYGGTISVESEVGKGSTFTVTLPLTRNA